MASVTSGTQPLVRRGRGWVIVAGYVLAVPVIYLATAPDAVPAAAAGAVGLAYAIAVLVGVVRLASRLTR